MQKKIVYFFIISLVLSLFSGCGFRLKGFREHNEELFKNTSISVIAGPRNHDSKIVNILTRQIRAFNFNYTDDVSKSDYYIEIIDARYNKEIQTKTTTGLVRQYLLILNVNYAIYHKNSNKFVLIRPEEGISIQKDYTYEPQNVLGSDSEEDIIAINLRKDASERILDVLINLIDEKNK